MDFVQLCTDAKDLVMGCKESGGENVLCMILCVILSLLGVEGAPAGKAQYFSVGLCFNIFENVDKSLPFGGV